jgi:hypothetical protein
MDPLEVDRYHIIGIEFYLRGIKRVKSDLTEINQDAVNAQALETESIVLFGSSCV